MSNEYLAKEVIAQACACNAKLITAESCTAGAVANVLSKSPGAGMVLQGGFITYSKEMKTKLLGVSTYLLQSKTAVCGEVAEAMAIGALARSGADIGAAVTGVAGPEPDEDGNPVGLVYCSVYSQSAGALTDRYFFPGKSRDEVIKAAVKGTLDLLTKICR